MHRKLLITLFLLAGLSLFVISGCSKSDDQRKFENEALTTPDGITQTNANGNVVDDNIDENDWRVGPMYRGLIQLKSEISDYPHPNPLGYNQNLTIQLKFNSTDVVNGIEIRKFRFPSDSNYPRLLQENELSSSVENITLQGKVIAENESSDARTTYRIMIYDGNQNLISYGDIRIE